MTRSSSSLAARLIDGNCSHIPLHCMYPGSLTAFFLIFCGHPVHGPAIIVVAFIIVALGGI